MKKLITIVALFSAGFLSAQAYKGAGDVKFDVGANFQDGGTGLRIANDYGYGQNISFGFVASYLLNVDTVLDQKPKFKDRVDLKARFNANLGDVLELDKKIDVYPGLNIGLRNLGAHLGMRYFFTDGFGLQAEAGLPIAKFKTDATGFEKLNNQFVFNIGVSFNM